MGSLEKWRASADKLLAAPVVRQRNIKTVAGKVEDRFEPILAARRRGMPWADIAVALEGDTPIKVDAVESAFKRICLERGIAPPGRRRGSVEKRATRNGPPSATPETQQTLFNEAPERWVDDGE
ncbi:MAG: hypothetical protein ACK4SZ_06780 [Allosphingosinicella sp.]|uniref:hypothetical protein n=1 Tax=Allosphingosinicella sp. TaxID=2823234 RepID=UPI0039344D8D